MFQTHTTAIAIAARYRRRNRSEDQGNAMLYQDHTTAQALTDRYRTTRPAGRRARRNRPSVRSVRAHLAGRPITRPAASS
ncbi:MAG: hypothetical protein OEP52_09050 [Acidimicrobiia bacterium]|nr:hypothetical protein [Acidimicrobiia bacterium]